MTSTRNPLVITDRVLTQVLAARVQQDDNVGQQNHRDGTGPERVWTFTGPAGYVAECARATREEMADEGMVTWTDIALAQFAGAIAESDPVALRTELLHVAAVAVAWIEAVDRRTAPATLAPEPPERPAAWAEVYPEMRRILDAVITAQRLAFRPTVDVAGLVHVRRQLGQLDRGTYQACTRVPGAWSSHAAFRLVRDVVDITPLGHPAAAAILRLAADLADQNAAAREALIRAKETPSA